MRWPINGVDITDLLYLAGSLALTAATIINIVRKAG